MKAKNRFSHYILSTFLLFIFLSPLLIFRVNKSINNSIIKHSIDVETGVNRSFFHKWQKYRRSPCFYLHDGIIFDYGLALYIHKEFQPTSVMEYGSGLGFYLDYFYRKANASVTVGIESYDMRLPEFHLYKSVNNKSLDNRAFYPAQFTVDIVETQRKQSVVSTSFSTYDVVYSLEAAHLIESKNHNLLADFLVAHTRHWLVFSSGRPGQEAVGHVGLRNISDWIVIFQQRGMLFMPIRTSKLRLVLGTRQPERKKNLLIFRRINKNESMAQYEHPKYSSGFYNHLKRQQLNVVKELWLSAFMLQANNFQKYCAKFENVTSI